MSETAPSTSSASEPSTQPNAGEQLQPVAGAEPSTQLAASTEQPQPPSAPAPSPAPQLEPMKAFEQHAQEQKTLPWLVAATKAYFGIAQGREMTLTDFKAKVDEVAGSKISSR